MFPSKNHPGKDSVPLGSIPEIADYLRVSVITVRRKITSGELPATRIGKQIRIRWADVEALIRRGSVPPDGVTRKALI
jgi:excisionase family DNA binding protein